MTSLPSRRQFLATLGASAGAVALAGCLGTGFPGGSPTPDRTVYVGAYHWGFVLLDEDGEERERFTFEPDATVLIVAFNTSAGGALAELPRAVRDAVPDHEALEERNEERVPPPSRGMHEALEEANDRYPDHSLAVMPSGYNRGQGPMDGPWDGGMKDGGMMGGGMMLHPIALPHDAPRPTTAGVRATERGDYTLSCQTYCGYGHPFMDRDGAFVVR